MANQNNGNNICFVIRTDQKKIVYLGKMNSTIRKRAQAYANKVKTSVQLFFNGKAPVTYNPK